jgi:hypothetical protein
MIDDKKQVYRVIIKLLSFLGLGLLSYFLIRTAIIPPLPQMMQKVTAIQVNLTDVEQGQMKIINWNHKNIAILHRSQAMQTTRPKSPEERYFVFINAGGDLNCPLNIEITQTYLKDSCSAYLYDSHGKALKPSARVKDLKIPPHHFIDRNHLLIGAN